MVLYRCSKGKGYKNMKLNNSDMEIALYELLLDGTKLRVTVKNDILGCADVQDACEEEGSVLLFKRGNNYVINLISNIDENLLCVEDFDYIAEIVDTFEKF